jgi:DNA topoisomerase-1
MDAGGRPVTDPATLHRIRALVIPPAWREVWICPYPNGHIQATGVDARGRTQYRYHDQWRQQRDRAKFDHMLEFARALPRLREAVAADLRGSELSEARVLAGAVRLLDLGFFRIGSECYAEENQTYGLTTLLRSHVHVDGQSVVFDFPAKGGKRRLQAIVDEDVRDLVASLRRRRGGGDALLAWKRPGGRGDRRWVAVDSDAVNAYVRDRAAVECSAKDFRTWNATVLAAVALSVSTGAASPTARKRCVARAMTEVSHYLGNTPAVVRRSYVDPRVVDRFYGGMTIAPALGHLGEEAKFGEVATRGAVEEAVIDLLGDGGPVGALRAA